MVRFLLSPWRLELTPSRAGLHLDRCPGEHLVGLESVADVVRQSWIGGQSVYLLLVAIWPSTANIPNGIPNSGTDTKHFLGFFLFSLLMLVPVWFRPHQIRHLFTLKVRPTFARRRGC